MDLSNFESINQFLKTEDEIEAWLDDKGIERFRINPDLTVDVDGLVDLDGKLDDNIPVKFGKVDGDFWCSDNPKITSLVGAPSYVGGDFWCQNNPKLMSLEGAPSHVGGAFYFRNNPKLKAILGVMLINGVKSFTSDNKAVQDIINVALKNHDSIFDVQKRLIDAGLEEYAQL